MSCWEKLEFGAVFCLSCGAWDSHQLARTPSAQTHRFLPQPFQCENQRLIEYQRPLCQTEWGRPWAMDRSGPKDESWAGDRRNAKTVEFIQLRAEVRHFKNHKVQENSCWSVRRICKSTLCFKPEESPNSGLKTQDQPRTSQLSSAEQSTAARFTDEKNPEVSSQVWSIKFNVSLVILKSSRNAQIYERLSTTFNPHFTFVFYI